MTSTVQGDSDSAWWSHIARYCDTIVAIPCVARCLFREVMLALLKGPDSTQNTTLCKLTTRSVYLLWVVIRYRDDPCANTIFHGFEDIFGGKEGVRAFLGVVELVRSRNATA